MMPSLFFKVLECKDLSKAGDLFSVEDEVIVEEFSQIIAKIQDISSAPEFLSSHNDQSLVEICVTRVISAVRETNSIQQHARCLVGLLQSCLAHSLRAAGGSRGGIGINNAGSGPGTSTDPPHAKMASDIMSCLFLNYNKKSVMQLAIPVAVKFLHKGNKDLSRNMSSYLSLAAIENADLLAAHVQPILDSVISGNYSLSRVLPSIFSVDRQLIRNHVMTLVSILPNCGDSDSLALLTLFGLIAKDSPRLLEPSIPQLCECLSHQVTANPTLQVLQDIATALPQCLVDHMTAFKATASNFPKTTVPVIQLLTMVGLTTKDRSREVLSYMMDVVGGVEGEKHSLVLKEVMRITRKYPTLLNSDLVNNIAGLNEGANSATKTAIQEIQNEFNMIRVDRSMERISIDKNITRKVSGGVTIVNVGGGGSAGSKPDSLNAKEVAKGYIPQSTSASSTSFHFYPGHAHSSTSHLYQQQQQHNRVELTSVVKHERDSAGFSQAESTFPESSFGSRQQLLAAAETRQQLLTAAENRQQLVTSVENRQQVAVTAENRQQLLASATSADNRQQQLQLFSSAYLDRNLGSISERQYLQQQLQQQQQQHQQQMVKQSRSTGRLNTHRSMTRLNLGSSASRLENRILHKSMTRLDHRYNSAQTVTSPTLPAVYNQPSPVSVTSGGGIAPSSGRSITSIASSSYAQPSRTQHAQGLVTHTASNQAHTVTSHVPTIFSTHGAASPTKSMSSGSMSGLERDMAGREILTVNINQITHDLARQSHQLSSVFSRPLPPDYHHRTDNPSLPPVTVGVIATGGGAPLSLPPYSARRFGPYSSGPLPVPSPTSPPPLSLALPPPQSPLTLPNSLTNSQPLDHRASQDRILPASSPGHPPPQRSTFSNTLPSLRRRSHHVTSAVSSSDGGDLSSAENPNTQGGKNNRVSVFEPFPMRDTVQHFCEKHLDKIKSYMESVSVKIPLPVKCTIEERKGKKHAKLHFACQGRGTHCLYKTTFYTMKSRHPRSWIHLMFLALQSRSQSALSTRDSGVSSLKNCWEILKCEEKNFSTLVTGAFPPAKDQDSIIHELNAHRFFDVFEYNGPKLQWGCFLCNHPERASTFLTEEEPVIEGQLKEKKGGKWKIFKKWKSRYFTLSGARLAYKEGKESEGGITQALDVGSIRSVKVSKGGRNIPKAFEIFTADKTFVLKAKDSSNAQAWVQCLTVAVAHSQAKDSTLRKLAYGGSLGRLNHGHNQRGFHSNITANNFSLRTAV